MKKINYLLLIAVLSVLIVGCSEEQVDENKTLINMQDNSKKTKFDDYLEREYRIPYNIAFDYKLKDSDKTDREMEYMLVPVRTEKAIEMANIIKYVCLDAYKKVAPNDFLKRYFPKKLRIIGSGPFDERGNEIIGLATDGLEITLYHINTFGERKISNTTQTNEEIRTEATKLYSRVIIHEFSHIMHHKVDYPQGFKTITDKDYLGGAWSESSEQDSYEKGFVSPYARKEYNEDFVEVLSHYVILTTSEWNDILEKAGTNGAMKINEKLEIVKNYMLDTWNVDIELLRKEVQNRVANLPNVDLTNIE